MVRELKLRKIGNSVGVVLPKEVLSYLKVEEGDTVCVTEAPDGSVRVGASSAEFTRQMEAADEIVRRYRNALKELAR
jgi:putative addiction module antidote